MSSKCTRKWNFCYLEVFFSQSMIQILSERTSLIYWKYWVLISKYSCHQANICFFFLSQWQVGTLFNRLKRGVHLFNSNKKYKKNDLDCWRAPRKYNFLFVLKGVLFQWHISLSSLSRQKAKRKVRGPKIRVKKKARFHNLQYHIISYP